MTKSNFEKSVMTSLQWRHRYYVTEKLHQTNITIFFHFGLLSIKIPGYVSECKFFIWCQFWW